MRVYLDNNILIDIEGGITQAEDFLSKHQTEYYYSDAHISELLNGVDKEIPGLIEKRITTIKTLCGKRFLVQDAPGYRMGIAECEPQQAFDNASRLGILRHPINNFVQSSTPNRQGVLSELGLDPRVVGSLNPNEVFDVIEESLLLSKYQYSIKDYLQMSEAITGRTVFASLFNLLDMVGYRKDKDGIARLYDSSHAYYAQLCDILVSNDARMRMKTEAVYHYLHIGTLVMDGKAFIDLVA